MSLVLSIYPVNVVLFMGQLGKKIIVIIVRLCGLILFFIGLWVVVQTLQGGVALYHSPVSIERMAVIVEKATGVDRALDSWLSARRKNESAAQSDDKVLSVFRMSYFIAWVLELLLLLVLAKIALSATKIGGEIVLYGSGRRQDS